MVLLLAAAAQKSGRGTRQNLMESYDNWNALLDKNQQAAQANYQPYMEAGKQGLNALMDPGANFQASPDYQWRLKQGLGAVTQNKAVNGLLQSGSALKAISDYGQGAASQEYGNWWDRQAGLAGMGQQAVGAATNLGTATANQMGTNMVNKYETNAQLKAAAQAQSNAVWGSLLGAASGAFGA